MENLTDKQKEIIDSLMTEFKKSNCMPSDKDDIFKYIDGIDQSDEIQKLQDKCNEFAESVFEKIDSITNSLDHISGSVFSYNKDRLKLFIDELNNFKPHK